MMDAEYRRAALVAIAIATASVVLLLLHGCRVHASAAVQVPARAENVPAFEEFQLLVDRNIFSPSRMSQAAVEAQADAAPAARPTLRLMGTVLNDGKRRALFEGDAEAPQAGAGEGDTVATYTVEMIGTHGVTLKGEIGSFDLAVGAGMAKRSDGRWTPVDASLMPRSEDPFPEESPPPAEASGSEQGEAASVDDALEKLRERRRRELGQ